MALIRRGKKGSWEKLPNFLNEEIKREGRSPPKESKGELECRRVLEKIFKKPFPKARPNILSNSVTGGNNLELDCYNSELKIAAEYNGQQHYNFIPYFHKNKEAFLNQKYRDELKRRMCADNKIFLIEVPYTVKVEKIESFILEKLKDRIKK